MTSLVEADSVEVLVIVDNEIDPLSSFQNPGVQVSGNMLDVAMRGPGVSERGGAVKELRMDNVCCGAHGLSLMIVSLLQINLLVPQLMIAQTAVKGETRHTVLFDTGPEEKIWQENVKRLRADVSGVELIQLSHWHRDHSGTYSFPSTTLVVPDFDLSARRHVPGHSEHQRSKSPKELIPKVGHCRSPSQQAHLPRDHGPETVLSRSRSHLRRDHHSGRYHLQKRRHPHRPGQHVPHLGRDPTCHILRERPPPLYPLQQHHRRLGTRRVDQRRAIPHV